MLSTGHLIFAALFIITFTIVIFLQYRMDKKLHLANYRGATWVLLIFMVFLIFLFGIKYFLKN